MAVEACRSAASACVRSTPPPSASLRSRRRSLGRAGQRPDAAEWTAFALLLPLAALAPRFRVSVGRNHGFHPGSCVHRRRRPRPAPAAARRARRRPPPAGRGRATTAPWYIQAFNLSNYTLSALGAWAVAAAVGTTGDDASFALAGLLAAAVFVAVNHGLLAIMLRLGRGHTLRESGLFSATGLGIEFVLAGLGVAVGAFAEFNPWLLPALIAPLVLAHRSLSTVALLRESEERFRTMFESAPTAMMLFGVDGTIIAVNRSAEALLGLPEEDELRGQHGRPVPASGRPRGGVAHVRGARPRRTRLLPARGARS